MGRVRGGRVPATYMIVCFSTLDLVVQLYLFYPYSLPFPLMHMEVQNKLYSFKLCERDDV